MGKDGFGRMTPDAVATVAVNIAGTVYNNPKFAGAPRQPVEPPTWKAATDLVAAHATAVDGGKKALRQQKHPKTAWNSQPLANVRPPVMISGLTPGTTDVFQARAVTKAGYTDYGQPATPMLAAYRPLKGKVPP